MPASSSEPARDTGPRYHHLRLERPADGVAVLVLDQPDKRNAMSDEMTASWVRAIDELTHDVDLRAVVVTGAGSAFTSGGDLAWLAGGGELEGDDSEDGDDRDDATVDRLRAKMLPFYRAWLSIRRLEVPTIAAINGPAVGAGLCLALACDLRYAAAGARMGVPFVKLGLHPGMAGTHLLPDAVGEAVARELMLTGRMVEAAEALRIGLVSRVLPAESFHEEVLEIAAGIAHTAPVASRLTTLALRARHADLETALQWEALAQPVTMATADLQEGLRAVREKRAPVFTGR